MGFRAGGAGVERGYAGLSSLLRAKREPEMVLAPVRGAEHSFIKADCSLLRAKREPEKHQRFRRAGSDGLRYPASTSCLGRHSCPADRGPNSSSLFPPLAAVVAVARKGLLAPFRPQRGCRSPKMLAASLNAFLGLLRFTAPPMVLRFRRTLRSARA